MKYFYNITVYTLNLFKNLNNSFLVENLFCNIFNK